MHPPPLPSRADFTLTMECTPESGHCHSMCVLCGSNRSRILGRKIGTKSLQSSLLAIHSHLYLSKSGLKLVCKVNIVYGNLNKSENSQDYAQKPQRNCTFMNSASVQLPAVSPIHGRMNYKDTKPYMSAFL
jgi:hypothetical protein